LINIVSLGRGSGGGLHGADAKEAEHADEGGDEREAESFRGREQNLIWGGGLFKCRHFFQEINQRHVTGTEKTF